jgi:hypothetical protein
MAQNGVPTPSYNVLVWGSDDEQFICVFIQNAGADE